MSRRVEFKYFLNEVEIDRELIDWSSTSNRVEFEGGKIKVTQDEIKKYPKINEHFNSYSMQDHITKVNRFDPLNTPLNKPCNKGISCLCDGSCIKDWSISDNLLSKSIFNSLLKDVEEGKKENEGKLDYSEIDWDFISQIAKRMSSNKDKYEANNWKKPMNIELLKQSLLRHVIEVLKGNYEDSGDKFGHVTAVACNAQMLNYQLNSKLK